MLEAIESQVAELCTRTGRPWGRPPPQIGHVHQLTPDDSTVTPVYLAPVSTPNWTQEGTSKFPTDFVSSHKGEKKFFLSSPCSVFTPVLSAVRASLGESKDKTNVVLGEKMNNNDYIGGTLRSSSGEAAVDKVQGSARG